MKESVQENAERKYNLELRSTLIKALLTIEAKCGLSPSVLTREQRKKIEMALGRDLTEFLSN